MAGLVAIACSGPSKSTDTTAPATECTRADSLLAEAEALKTDGYLGRALPLVERAYELCSSDITKRARAGALADLWIDGSIVNERDATDDEIGRARLLYRAGQVLRERDGKHDASLARLEESYALWPHPLTLVQMSLSHRAAGREVEYRKSNARALAVAQRTQDASARPMLVTGHADSVSALAFHPQRAVIASGDWSGLILLWDMMSGRSLGRFGGHTSPVYELSFSPDGALLASIGLNNGVALWDVASGTKLRTLAPGASVYSLAFGPNGRRVATADQSSTVALWDVSTGSAERRLGHAERVFNLAFSHDGARLAVATTTTLTLWDIASGTELQRWNAPGDTYGSMAFIADGAELVTVSDEAITTWDASGGSKTRALAAPDAANTFVDMSPKGDRLAIGRGATTIAVVDGATGDELQTLQGQFSKVTSVALSPGGLWFATGVDDTVTVWNTETGSERVLRGEGDRVWSVAFSPNGTQLASSASSAVELWNLATGDAPRTFEGHTAIVTSVELSADGARLASASEDKTAKVWDIGSGEIVQSLVHADSVWSATFRPGSPQLATTDGSAITLWDIDTGAALQTIEHFNGWAVELDPDGRTLASIGNQPLRLWDVESGEQLGSFSHGYTRSAAFSPDGRQLVSASENGTLAVWDVATGKILRSLAGHTNRVLSMAQRADGAQLASGSEDRTIKVWDVATGTELHTLTGHGGSVWSVAYSPDGAVLASSGDDRTVRLWHVESGAHLATLFSTGTGTWVVLTPGGRVDGSPGDDGGQSLLYWQVGDYQLPGFVGWQRYHTPGLLGEILAKPPAASPATP